MAGWIQCMQDCLLFLSFSLAKTRYSSQTNIYAQGVGLGASKGRELGKYADGYTGYVHMAQDAVSVFHFPLSAHNQWKIWCICTHLHPLQVRERFGS
jgi:RNA-binding protein 5/10